MLELPPLPYGQDALEPHISEKTLSFHYGKHHKGYVDKANSMIEGTELDKLGLVELIRKVAGDSSKKGLFNNAAQVWNHDFYWHSMSPKGGGEPKGALAKKIAEEARFRQALENRVETFGEPEALFGNAEEVGKDEEDASAEDAEKE